MPTIKKSRRRVRKTLELPQKLEAELADLAASLDMTVAELMRRGLERMVSHEKRRDQGFNIGAFKEDEEGRVVRAYLDEHI